MDDPVESHVETADSLQPKSSFSPEVEAADEAVDKMIDDGEKVAEEGLLQLTAACKIWIRKELSMALAGHSEETRQAENP